MSYLYFSNFPYTSAKTSFGGKLRGPWGPSVVFFTVRWNFFGEFRSNYTKQVHGVLLSDGAEPDPKPRPYSITLRRPQTCTCQPSPNCLFPKRFTKRSTAYKERRSMTPLQGFPRDFPTQESILNEPRIFYVTCDSSLEDEYRLRLERHVGSRPITASYQAISKILWDRSWSERRRLRRQCDLGEASVMIFRSCDPVATALFLLTLSRRDRSLLWGSTTQSARQLLLQGIEEEPKWRFSEWITRISRSLFTPSRIPTTLRRSISRLGSQMNSWRQWPKAGTFRSDLVGKYTKS